LRTRRPAIHMLRGGLMITANASQYAALAALSLADSTAICYSAPLLITVFSVVLLGDRVSVWRWSAVLVGLCGVMRIVRPGSEAFSPAAVLALGSAVVHALSQILTRWLGRTEQAITMSFYGQLALFTAAVAFGLAFGDGSFAAGAGPVAGFLLRAWVWPTAFDMFLFVVLGLISAVGGVIMTLANRDAPPPPALLPRSNIWPCRCPSSGARCSWGSCRMPGRQLASC